MSAAALFAAASIGDVVTYDALALAIGDDPREGGKGHVDSARKMARRDHRKVFNAIDNVGFVCLSPAEVVAKGSHRREKVRRQAIMTLKEYDTISTRDLPPATQAEYLANRTLAAALLNEASAKQAEQQRVNILRNILPVIQPDLSAFRGS